MWNIGKSWLGGKQLWFENQGDIGRLKTPVKPFPTCMTSAKSYCFSGCLRLMCRRHLAWPLGQSAICFCCGWEKRQGKMLWESWDRSFSARLDHGHLLQPWGWGIHMESDGEHSITLETPWYFTGIDHCYYSSLLELALTYLWEPIVCSLPDPMFCDLEISQGGSVYTRDTAKL